MQLSAYDFICNRLDVLFSDVNRREKAQTSVITLLVSSLFPAWRLLFPPRPPRPPRPQPRPRLETVSTCVSSVTPYSSCFAGRLPHPESLTKGGSGPSSYIRFRSFITEGERNFSSTAVKSSDQTYPSCASVGTDTSLVYSGAGAGSDEVVAGGWRVVDVLVWGGASFEAPRTGEGSGGSSDFKWSTLSFWSISKTKKSVNLRCKQ